VVVKGVGDGRWCGGGDGGGECLSGGNGREKKMLSWKLWLATNETCVSSTYKTYVQCNNTGHELKNERAKCTSKECGNKCFFSLV
jgi:hypothetical protein